MKISKEKVVGFRKAVDFPGGTSDFVVAIIFKCACGCIIEFGVRVDTKETAMFSWACEIHHPKWQIMNQMLLDPKFRDTPTEEVLLKGFAAMD